MEKEIFRTVRGFFEPDPQVASSPLKKVAEVPRSQIKKFINVRAISKIPATVLRFFKFDPKKRKNYSQDESILFSQVFLHELDEGIRFLNENGLTSEAKLLENFSNRQLHLTQRLELLRSIQKALLFKHPPPADASGCLKIRSNQVGSTRVPLLSSQIVAWTDAGIDYKERNEDAFLLVPQKGVFAIADGMGGHVGGEIASCIAIDFLEQGIMKGRSLEEAFVLANEAILTRSWSDSELGGMHPMGCTLIAAQLLGKRLKIAHVGDSKALVIRRGRCVFETQDHTQGQELFHDGFIDLDTAFELNHILNRCLGIDRIQWQRDVELSYVTLEPGDRILLVSDGVTDNFYNNQFEVDDLVAMVSTHDISLAAKKLAQECTRRMKLKELPYHRPAKADNFSFALLEYHP